MCQSRVSAAYQDQKEWTRKSILNVARVGYFSSDGAVHEYCAKVWKIKSHKPKLEAELPSEESVEA
jgi:starch phosphorylase